MRHARRAVVPAVALLALACAGGGGGGGGGASGGGTWSTPSIFPPPGGASIVTVQVRVAVDSTGAGMLFWSRSYSGVAPTDYQYSRYAAGAGWSAPVSFAPGVPVGSMPELGMQGDGGAVLAWYGGTGSVYVARAPKGGDFAAPATIAAATAPTGLRLHVRASGHAVLGWIQNDGGGIPHAWASVYAPGGTWSAAARLDTTAYGVVAASVRVAADGQGGAFAVWSEQDAGAAGVWTARYAASTWGAPVVLDTSSSSAAQPDVAASSDGRAVAAWMQPDATGMLQQVYTSRFAPTGGWTAPQLLMSSATATGYTFPYPRVAMNDGGEALAVWRELDRTTSEFTGVGSHAAAAGAWATPFLLDAWLASSSTSSDVSLLTPALAGTGSGVAIWCGMDQIHARTYHAGGTWGGASS